MKHVSTLALTAFFLVLFLFIVARAIDQNRVEHNPPVVPATGDTLPLPAEG